MRPQLPALYKKVKGSDEGYETYASQVTGQLTQRSFIGKAVIKVTTAMDFIIKMKFKVFLP
jgi:hypothetical protein